MIVSPKQPGPAGPQEEKMSLLSLQTRTTAAERPVLKFTEHTFYTPLQQGKLFVFFFFVFFITTSINSIDMELNVITINLMHLFFLNFVLLLKTASKKGLQGRMKPKGNFCDT